MVKGNQMARRTLSIADLFKVRVFTDLRLSPDGRCAVVCVRTPDLAEQRNVSTLWLYRRDDDSFEEITRGPADAGPLWLDARTILFTASKRERGEEEADKPFPRTRLYTISLRGGEPRLRATLDGHVWDMRASPDGRRLALAFSPNPEGPARQRKAWAKAVPPTVPLHLHWKLDGVGFLPATHPSIYLMETAGRRWGGPRLLAKGPNRWDGGIQWVDSRRLVFMRWDADRKDIVTDVMLADLTGRARRLATPVGPLFGACPSPDGRQLVFCGNDDPLRGGYLPTLLYARSTDPADGSWRVLAETDGQFGQQSTLSDVSQMGAPGFRWQGDERVVGPHSIRGRTELVRVEVGSGRREVLCGERGVVQLFDAAGDAVVYTWGDYTSPGELYRLGRKRPISRLNAAVSRRFDVVPDRWQVRAEKGVYVDAFLWATRAQLRARRRSLPLVVYVHGGPSLQTGEGAFHEYAWLAHQGYPVVAPNPRGSTGYGAAHGVAICGNWGDRDAHDVLAVRRDVLRRCPQFDPERTFIVGGSYGGYMTNWMLTRHPGVFRAGVSERSLSDHISFAGTSDFASQFAFSVLGIDSIWDDPVRAWELSPLSRAPQVRDPLLIIHSEGDLRCPIGQAEELFVALAQMGRKVDEDIRLVVFRQESHGLSRGGRPENRRVRLQEILGWLKKHDRPRPKSGKGRAGRA